MGLFGEKNKQTKNCEDCGTEQTQTQKRNTQSKVKVLLALTQHRKGSKSGVQSRKQNLIRQEAGEESST